MEFHWNWSILFSKVRYRSIKSQFFAWRLTENGACQSILLLFHHLHFNTKLSLKRHFEFIEFSSVFTHWKRESDAKYSRQVISNLVKSFRSSSIFSWKWKVLRCKFCCVQILPRVLIDLCSKIQVQYFVLMPKFVKKNQSPTAKPHSTNISPSCLFTALARGTARMRSFFSHMHLMHCRLAVRQFSNRCRWLCGTQFTVHERNKYEL